MTGLDDDPFGGQEKRSPNADILDELLRGEDLGNACIIVANGDTDVRVRSNKCSGIIDVRRPRAEPEECDPDKDPTCEI
jgi:hypothetical protein